MEELSKNSCFGIDFEAPQTRERTSGRPRGAKSKSFTGLSSRPSGPLVAWTHKDVSSSDTYDTEATMDPTLLQEEVARGVETNVLPL